MVSVSVVVSGTAYNWYSDDTTPATEITSPPCWDYYREKDSVLDITGYFEISSYKQLLGNKSAFLIANSVLLSIVLQVRQINSN